MNLHFVPEGISETFFYARNKTSMSDETLEAMIVIKDYMKTKNYDFEQMVISMGDLITKSNNII